MHTHTINDHKHTHSQTIRGFMIMAGVALVTATSVTPTNTGMQSYILRGSRSNNEIDQLQSRAEPKSAAQKTSPAERRRKRALDRMTQAIVAESTTDISPIEPLRPSAPTKEGVQESSTIDELVRSSLHFTRVVPPVSVIPHWGDMRTPAEWNRTYREMHEQDFIKLPAYDLERLTTPIKTILTERDAPHNIQLLTEKLFYSTRFFGAYDLDAAEFSAVHPGVDLKLPTGTPIAALADGVVQTVRTEEETLGLHVIIEHLGSDNTYYYSIYGHLGSTPLKEGQRVVAGDLVGLVGMTGNTSGAHLHLQVDVSTTRNKRHTPYWPSSMPSPAEAAKHTINPMTFILR